VSETPPVLRVVLVDDAVEIRELLRFMLDREPDFTVVAEAADGAAGVQAVIDTVPDLVLLDVGMPVMDGMEALRIIRVECPTAVVVMFSAFGDPVRYAREAVKLGAQGYIRKGDTLSGLTDQLRALVATARGVASGSADDSAEAPGRGAPGDQPDLWRFHDR
jgi:DNA-binding NarL/FixJ family response regulator